MKKMKKMIKKKNKIKDNKYKCNKTKMHHPKVLIFFAIKFQTLIIING